jgi:hypothetical protein
MAAGANAWGPRTNDRRKCRTNLQLKRRIKKKTRAGQPRLARTTDLHAKESSMSRSVIRWIRPRRRITVLAAACVAMAAAVVLSLIGTASAAPTTAIRTTPSCSNATLKGTYTFGYISWSISNGQSTPASEAGFDTFNGKGTGAGVITAAYNGVLAGNNTPDTSTYTISANCIGTIVFNSAGSLFHFNVYVSPSGNSFSLISTDPGTAVAGTETRVTR